MLVLHVVAPGDVGGLERVVQLLAQGQAARGEEVHVAVVLDRTGADHPLLATLAAGGATPHPIVLPGRAYGRERAAIRDLARRLRPAILHTHGCRPDVVDSGVGRRVGIPVVTTVHGFVGGGWKNRIYEWLQRRVYRRFDAVVAVSRRLRDELIRDGIAPQRVHVVQNAWGPAAAPLGRAAARRALGVSPEGFRVGWVGRLSAEKGADVLLDALADLSDLPISVSLVGNGSQRPALAAQARRLGVEGHVQWHGTVPDAGRQFAAFDAFVLSSRTEGTPIVLFEAMAAGVPIVTTRVGGVPDVLSREEAALVAPGDAAALAAELRAVYRDREAGRERARRARERLFREFTVPPWLERYDAVYRRVRRSPPVAAVAPAASVAS